jgi:hypothetical protein
MCQQHSKRVGIRLACAPHPFEISRPGQAEFALHPNLEMPNILVVSMHYAGVRAPPRRSDQLAILPPHFLDMLVGFCRQAIATSQAAALKHIAPVCGCHAFAEAMYAHAAADFGLIRSFRHILSFYKKIIAFPDAGNLPVEAARYYTVTPINGQI